MTETKRILVHGSYKVQDVSIKLDRRRLGLAPKHAFKFTDTETSEAAGAQCPSPCRVRIFQCDCLEAAELLKAEHPGSSPAVLDFASGSNPGGGVKGNQQGTQEEEICRRSSLLASLEQQEYPLPSMGGIYAPDVCVIRGPGPDYALLKEPFWVAVLAAEMPNCGDTGKKERLFIQQKIRGILHMALQQGHSSLVLGAWGCGAFGNDASIMATIFKDVAAVDKI
eukprot:Skav210645  [mRNA]  locus=scaffold2527:7829:8500:+ [translate_table: standard]